MSHITDHAVVRYLERVRGIDVDAVRREIAALPGLAQAIALGARSFSLGGFTYRIRNGFVVTIEPGDSPQSAHRGAKQFHGKSVRLRNLDNGDAKVSRRRAAMDR